MSVCNDDPDRAWEDFQANLAQLRDLAPVTTIGMHGSPLSPIDNRKLWQNVKNGVKRAGVRFGLLGY